MDQHHRTNLSCRFQKYSLEVADVLDQLLQALPTTWMKTRSNPAFSVSQTVQRSPMATLLPVWEPCVLIFTFYFVFIVLLIVLCDVWCLVHTFSKLSALEMLNKSNRIGLDWKSILQAAFICRRSLTANTSLLTYFLAKATAQSTWVCNVVIWSILVVNYWLTCGER